MLIAAGFACMALPWCAQAEQADAAPVRLKPEQVRSLGIEAEPAGRQTSGAAMAYPARVVVPTTQLRVVASALGGLVESVSVAVGDSVRAGQPLASLRSVPAQELQREVLQTASQADLAKRAMARDEQLHAEGLISTSRLESSRAMSQQAQALYAERQRTLAQTGVSPEVSSGGMLTLRSPMAGVVIEVQASVGQRVEQATALFRVAQLGTLWLEVQVPATDAQALALGDPVRLADGLTAGRIIAVGHTVDPATQSVTVRAEVRNAEGSPLRVRPGQVVEARVEPRIQGVVQVAEASVVRSGKGSAVFVESSPGNYRLASVKVHASAGGRSAVSGLTSDQRVVVKGTAALLALAQPQP
ncbi:MAG: efflux RND transporter periplasmic adaptor subunit [Burkholderiaceae bacterium]|nr:efflux RND transporter periplasmic adaptor subunit [Burkholderiaceae bacterium]